jgi:hypothetical protein
MEESERAQAISEFVDDLLTVDVIDSANIGSSENYLLLDDDEWVIDEVNEQLRGFNLMLVSQYGQVLLIRI